MSKVSLEEVVAIARLSRLALTEAELASLRAEVETIVTHIETLNELDTDGVVPMTHAYDVPLRVRPDEVEESLSVDDALTQAPQVDDDMFVVPAIIESSQK